MTTIALTVDTLDPESVGRARDLLTLMAAAIVQTAGQTAAAAAPVQQAAPPALQAAQAAAAAAPVQQAAPQAAPDFAALRARLVDITSKLGPDAAKVGALIQTHGVRQVSALTADQLAQVVTAAEGLLNG